MTPKKQRERAELFDAFMAGTRCKTNPVGTFDQWWMLKNSRERRKAAAKELPVAKPRNLELPGVVLVPYLKGWSYDFTACALARHLAHRFDIRIAYQDELGKALGEWGADLMVDFWWKGTLSRRFPKTPTVKQVSSHRWQQSRYGSIGTRQLARVHLSAAAVVAVPSQRLFDLVTEPSEMTTPTKICKKGFEPQLFFDYRRRRGSTTLTVGWAGAGEAEDKNVGVLKRAWPTMRLADKCLTPGEMPDFYNMADVIAIASDAEGDPRPLIEGMACGCFPVTTDVGIVPELVRHLDNGYIVEHPTADAFKAAFDWCQANLVRVRHAGQRNAETMRATRTWAHVAPAWGDAFDYAIASQRRI